jgi:hypothetical protein
VGYYRGCTALYRLSLYVECRLGQSVLVDAHVLIYAFRLTTNHSTHFLFRRHRVQTSFGEPVADYCSIFTHGIQTNVKAILATGFLHKHPLRVVRCTASFKPYGNCVPRASTVSNTSVCVCVFRLILRVNSVYFLKQR